MKNRIRIIFEDHGQKYKSWLIDGSGKIIDCEPEDAWLFVGLFINNADSLKVGGFVEMGTNKVLSAPIKEIISLKKHGITV